MDDIFLVSAHCIACKHIDESIMNSRRAISRNESYVNGNILKDLVLRDHRDNGL